MASQRRRQVCLFGLSADPPTGQGGHVGIVQALSQQPNFDEIRILPVYRHTYAVRTNQTNIDGFVCALYIHSSIIF